MVWHESSKLVWSAMTSLKYVQCHCATQMPQKPNKILTRGRWNRPLCTPAVACKM